MYSGFMLPFRLFFRYTNTFPLQILKAEEDESTDLSVPDIWKLGTSRLDSFIETLFLQVNSEMTEALSYSKKDKQLAQDYPNVSSILEELENVNCDPVDYLVPCCSSLNNSESVTGPFVVTYMASQEIIEPGHHVYLENDD